jgi:hypothetical protein
MSASFDTLEALRFGKKGRGPRASTSGDFPLPLDVVDLPSITPRKSQLLQPLDHRAPGLVSHGVYKLEPLGACVCARACACVRAGWQPPGPARAACTSRGCSHAVRLGAADCVFFCVCAYLRPLLCCWVLPWLVVRVPCMCVCRGVGDPHDPAGSRPAAPSTAATAAAAVGAGVGAGAAMPSLIGIDSQAFSERQRAILQRAASGKQGSPEAKGGVDDRLQWHFTEPRDEASMEGKAKAWRGGGGGGVGEGKLSDCLCVCGGGGRIACWCRGSATPHSELCRAPALPFRRGL